METLVFWMAAAALVAFTLLTIASRNPVYSACFMILSFAATAALFVLLDAWLLAAVEVLVYAGAIMVLFLFVIMLLNAGIEERTNISRLARYVGVPAAGILGVALVWRLAQSTRSLGASPLAEKAVDTRELALMLFKDYVLPFELTSVLILIAILGAVVLAKRDVTAGG